jgi:hypothetical protein
MIKQHTLCPAMPCYALLCPAMPCYALLFPAMPCYALLCHAMPCSAILCHAEKMKYNKLYAMLCHAMTWHAMTWHDMPCHALVDHQQWMKYKSTTFMTFWPAHTTTFTKDKWKRALIFWTNSSALQSRRRWCRRQVWPNSYHQST